MKTDIKVFREIPTTVYNLEWICPICGHKNMAYYFQDWDKKKMFWCIECHKVSWLKRKD